MKALTIGGAMIDTISIIESSRIERMTMLNADTSYLLLAEGHKTEALEISTHCGGGAVNAAVAMTRLGLDVAILAKLGRDQRAETVLNRLMLEGVSTRWAIRDERAATGASVIVSSHDRNAAIFTFRGANALLERGDLRPDAFSVDLVHVSSLSNKSADCFPAIVAAADKTGAFVSINPGIRQLSSRGNVLLDALGQVDLLTLNKQEAAVLVPTIVAITGEGGVPLSEDATEPASQLARLGLVFGGYEVSLRSFFAGLIRAGLRYALVTDGASGAFLADADGIWHCPAAPTTVAGTAGAGDAFAATLATYLSAGRKVEEAMRAASINAAAVVAHIDTQTGLMTRALLDAAVVAASSTLSVQFWAHQRA